MLVVHHSRYRAGVASRYGTTESRGQVTTVEERLDTQLCEAEAKIERLENHLRKRDDLEDPWGFDNPPGSPLPRLQIRGEWDTEAHCTKVRLYLITTTPIGWGNRGADGILGTLLATNDDRDRRWYERQLSAEGVPRVGLVGNHERDAGFFAHHLTLPVYVEVPLIGLLVADLTGKGTTAR